MTLYCSVKVESYRNISLVSDNRGVGNHKGSRTKNTCMYAYFRAEEIL